VTLPGGQQPSPPVLVPEKVPVIVPPLMVPLPLAEPVQGGAKVTVAVTVFPLMFPWREPKPGTLEVMLHPDCWTVTVPAPEPPQELAKLPL
jgi:hypothetical protein